MCMRDPCMYVCAFFACRASSAIPAEITPGPVQSEPTPSAGLGNPEVMTCQAGFTGTGTQVCFCPRLTRGEVI